MEAKSLNEIRKMGIDALANALGPIGMVKFIQSFDLRERGLHEGTLSMVRSGHG